MTKAYDFCEKFGEYWTDECGKQRWTWKERSPDCYSLDNVTDFGGVIATIMTHKPNTKYSYKIGFITQSYFTNFIPTDYNLLVFYDGSWIVDDGCAELSKPDIGWTLDWNGPSANLFKLAKQNYERLVSLRHTYGTS